MRAIPVKQLLSKPYAAKRASLIDPARANCAVAPGALSASDTTYFSVVDREGNILSIIQSNYSSFGSKITVQGMGFALQNRGGLFSLDSNSPNALAGHKRPFHTIIPAFMEHGDRHIGFGIMGGMNQPLAHAQFVSNVVDYKMNIQAALEEPRFTVDAKLGCNILIESRVTPESIERLTKIGHVLEVRKEYSSTMGAGRRSCAIVLQRSITALPIRERMAPLCPKLRTYPHRPGNPRQKSFQASQPGYNQNRWPPPPMPRNCSGSSPA